MTIHKQLREALDRKLAAKTAAEREDAAEAFGRLVRLAWTGRPREHRDFMRISNDRGEA
jgi:hypothetical protein